MKKLLTVLMLCAVCVLLGGCGGYFEKEYVSVSPYTVQAQPEKEGAERVVVKNMGELKNAVMSMVYDGAQQGSIDFDSEYSGDAQKDMEAACWQVRTQDALSAFCVKSLNYSLERIVTHYEATVSIEYSEYAPELGSIIKLPYAVGVSNLLKNAMDGNTSRLVILINAGTYSADQIEALARSIYRSYPTICVSEPNVKVFMYSGSGKQRLYDINFDYGMSEDVLIRGKAQLKNLDVVSKLDCEGMDDAHAALAAAKYIVENCTIGTEGSSCFDCLINGTANSEGVSLAYVEMLSQLGIGCKIVYGQYNGENYCWNIIKIEGSSYHVDVCRCAIDGYFVGFLRSDEKMWGDYRWNISDYESCTGAMSFLSVASSEELEALFGTEAAEEGTQQGEEQGEGIPEQEGEHEQTDPEAAPSPTPEQ